MEEVRRGKNRWTIIYSSSDRVALVLMSVSLGRGLCRLLCVLYGHRSGLTRERKKRVTPTVRTGGDLLSFCFCFCHLPGNSKAGCLNVRIYFVVIYWRRVKKV